MCSTAICGDGTVDDGEACDDGNIDAGDGCDADCQLEDVCGNGVVDEGETCDDGNTDAGDGCDADCQAEVVCGNGLREGDEACDDGNLDGGDGCSPTCTLEAVCGNGLLERGEACDDGNNDDGDGCDASCQFEAFCGDGQLQGAEECDDANDANGDGCDALCTRERQFLIRGAEQRTGAVPAGEADLYFFTADDLAQLDVFTGDGDGGCPADTLLELFSLDAQGNPTSIATDDDGGAGLCSRLGVAVPAGNYALTVTGFGGAQLAGYTLDYGLTVDVRGGGQFGGAFVQGGDDWFTFSLAQQRPVRVATGDGRGGCPGDTLIAVFLRQPDGSLLQVQADDNGGVAPCSLVQGDAPAGDYVVRVQGAGGRAIGAYVLNARFGACGDGVQQAGEACDDGNLDPGDGCSPICEVEPICGDGVLNLDEECDDGNTDAGDGCDADCLIEPVCGNGIIERGETCDDGNGDAGDGCDAQCIIEVDCGNGAIDGAEECDDGNLDNGDGCDALCTAERYDVITGSAAGDGLAIDDGQTDTFAFIVDDESILTFGTSDGADGCPAGIDTFLTLNGPEGEVTTDDDGGAGLCSRLQARLSAGAYELVVTELNGARIDAYAVEFRLEQPVDQGGAFDGAFVQGGNDLFSLTLAEEASVQFATGDGDGGCPGDTTLTLATLDAQGQLQQIAFDDDGGVGTCSLLGVVLPAGQYDLFAAGFGGGAVGPYVLTVSFAVCGNGQIDGAETCDDGNVDPGDGCDASCQIEPFCGDGALDEGETCDDANNDPGDGCDPFCQLECGNGTVNRGEQCDDGNRDAGDGCDPRCQIEVACGNERVEPGEQCDDGNTNAGDGCDDACQFESI